MCRRATPDRAAMSRPVDTAASSAASGLAASRFNYLPATRHTYRSDVNISRLSEEVMGVRRAEDGRLAQVKVAIKGLGGALLDSAIPKVSVIKDGNYTGDSFEDGIESQVDVLALLDNKLRNAPLAGFVLEGLSPYGTPTSRARHQVCCARFTAACRWCGSDAATTKALRSRSIRSSAAAT